MPNLSPKNGASSYKIMGKMTEFVKGKNLVKFKARLRLVAYNMNIQIVMCIAFCIFHCIHEV